MGQRDFAAARKLLCDDVSFTGPIGSFGGADALLTALRALQTHVERAEMKKVFSDGRDVCVVFDLVFKKPHGTALVAEWYRVKDGQIATMRAMFDARPFNAVLKTLEFDPASR